MKIMQKFFAVRDKNTNFKLIFTFILGLFLLFTSCIPKKKIRCKKRFFAANK